MGFKSSGEALTASKFYQRYTAFIMRHYNKNTAVGTLLTGFYTLDKFTQVGTFGTWHELEKEIKNDSTQLLA